MPRKDCRNLQPGSTAFTIYQQLQAGGWTTRQLAALANTSVRYAAAVVSQLRKAKLVHCCGYTHHQTGDHGGPQAIYAAGDKPNVRRPMHLTPRGSWRKYDDLQWLKKQEPRPVTSVFDLAERYR